jgi:sulfonate transport system substrate-binding protein
MKSNLRLMPLATLLSVLMLSGCAKSPKEDLPVLRVADQLQVVQSAVDAAGEGKPATYHIEWSNFLGGPAVIAAQTGGSVDLGWMAETPLVYAQAAGSPVKVVAVSQGTKPGASNIALVVAANSPIRSVADLRGKKVGMMAGTIAQYLVLRLLDQAGMSPKDIIQVQATSVSTAVLDRGIVDAVISAEPLLTQTIAAGKVRVLAYGGEPNTPGFGYLVASDAALADPKRAALIGDFVTRVARSVQWQRRNVDKAALATAKAYNVTPQIAEKVLKRTPIRYTPIDPSVVAKHQQEADVFEKLGLIRKHVDAAKLFDNRYNALVAQVEKGQ